MGKIPEGFCGDKVLIEDNFVKKLVKILKFKK